MNILTRVLPTTSTRYPPDDDPETLVKHKTTAYEEHPPRPASRKTGEATVAQSVSDISTFETDLAAWGHGRAVTSSEVKDLRRQAKELKEVVAEQALELCLLKKA